MSQYIMNIDITLVISLIMTILFIWSAALGLAYKGYEKMDHIWISSMIANVVIVIGITVLIFNLSH